MHEHSLVLALLEQVHEVCRERRIQNLCSVRIAIGEFSGVESALVQTAFEELQPDYFPHPIPLQIDLVPLTARCCVCRSVFGVESFQFVCPLCHATEVSIISGDELRLISLDGTLDNDECCSPPVSGRHPLAGSPR